jgi:hypothetical protein
MCLLPVKSDRVAFHYFGAEHYAQGKLHGFEDRALLYMQFEIRACMGAFASRIPDAVNIDLTLA